MRPILCRECPLWYSRRLVLLRNGTEAVRYRWLVLLRNGTEAVRYRWLVLVRNGTEAVRYRWLVLLRNGTEAVRYRWPAGGGVGFGEKCKRTDCASSFRCSRRMTRSPPRSATTLSTFGIVCQNCNIVRVYLFSQLKPRDRMGVFRLRFVDEGGRGFRLGRRS
jgi:hypothetical protein